MKYYNKIIDLIGNTPILKLNEIEKETKSINNLFAKMEMFNPAGSIKDRAALKMIEEAINDGLINQETLIVDATSGNTGIGLSMVCALKKLKLVITMPDSMSNERIKLMEAYGTKVVLTPGILGMSGAIDLALKIKEENKNSFMPSQFDNFNNPLAHYTTTGPEIYDAMDGNIDYLISAIGTGGTISGIGKFLKEKNPNIKIIGVEPLSSPFITKGISGSHKIQGIGAGFIPKILNLDYVDEILTITNEEAYRCANLIAKKEGILVGISSGAALGAALELSKKIINKNIIIIFSDSGERYLSTDLY